MMVLFLILLIIIQNSTESIKLKQKNKGLDIGDDSINNVETMVSLKYLSNFWRTFQMLLINCEANILLCWRNDLLYLLMFLKINNNICNN